MTPSRVITSVRRTARAAAGILVDNFCPFWGLGCPKRGLKNGDTIDKKNYSILKESFDTIKLNKDLTKHRTQYKNVLATIGAYITIIGGLIDIGIRIHSRIATGHSHGLFSKTNGQKKLEIIENKLNNVEQNLKS
ncbi:MAG: hypothetical protein LEGION0398_MBIBDBAK_01066 [Legionellaceae bacterium]